MTISINDTTTYHQSQRASLGWEQTISECLRDISSPYQEALKVRRRYADVVGDHLEHKGMIREGFRILEVGGGYGNLASGLLSRFGTIHMTMVDISPVFSAAQRETLRPYAGRVSLVEADIFEYLEHAEGFDLIISNENMGDFPAIVDIDKGRLIDFIGERLNPGSMDDGEASILSEARDFVGRLGIELSSAPEILNLNTGAIKFVESAMGKTRRLFVTEHSSDWTPPESSAEMFRDTRTHQWPEKIILFGHTEVSVSFAHLRRALSLTGGEIDGGRLMDLIGTRDDSEIRYILLSGSITTTLHEIIGEFMDHVKEYQWLSVLR